MNDSPGQNLSDRPVAGTLVMRRYSARKVYFDLDIHRRQLVTPCPYQLLATGYCARTIEAHERIWRRSEHSSFLASVRILNLFCLHHVVPAAT